MKPSEAYRCSCLTIIVDYYIVVLGSRQSSFEMPMGPMRPGMCHSVRLPLVLTLGPELQPDSPFSRLWFRPYCPWPWLGPLSSFFSFACYNLVLLQISGLLLIPQRNWPWPSTLDPPSPAHCFSLWWRRRICWYNYSINDTLFLTSLETQPRFLASNTVVLISFSVNIVEQIKMWVAIKNIRST